MDRVSESGEVLSLIAHGNTAQDGWSGGVSSEDFDAWIAHGAKRIDGGDFADLREQAAHNAVLAALERIEKADRRTSGSWGGQKKIVVLDGNQWIVPAELADAIELLRARAMTNGDCTKEVGRG